MTDHQETYNVSRLGDNIAAERQDGLLPVEGLPWEADSCLRVAVFEGRSLRLREVYECPEEGMVLLIRPGHGETCPMSRPKKG